MDRLSKEKRSWNMRRIPSSNTKPEIKVRRQLHALGYRFRLHRADLPGKPDIVLPKHRLAILVHGCFWHRHRGCKYAYSPKTRTEFWKNKFNSNVQRDQLVIQELERLGWNTAIVWECETRNADSLQELLLGFLP